MSDFAAGKNAKGVCDICGLTFKLKELKSLVVNRKDTRLKSCDDCWTPDHPQLFTDTINFNDPQALREPRPDSNLTESRNITWGWRPCYSLQVVAEIGQVSV